MDYFNFTRQLFFTIIFDVEVLMKLLCFGVNEYFKRNMLKYELFLACATTVGTAFTDDIQLRSVPVLRIIRLIKLSPTLENFVYKVGDVFYSRYVSRLNNYIATISCLV